MKNFIHKKLIKGVWFLSGLVLVGGSLAFYYEYLKRETTQFDPLQKKELINTPSTEPLTQESTLTSGFGSSSKTGIGIPFEEDRTIGPFPPQSLNISFLSNEKTSLKWYDADVFISHFNVYRKEPNSSQWISIGRVSAKADQETYSFIDEYAQKDLPYIYAVTAVDVYENESSYLESAP